MQQKAYSFDEETVVNIIAGFLHSFVVGSLILLVETGFQLAGTVTITDPMLAPVYVFVVNSLYNAAREWAKGV